MSYKNKIHSIWLRRIGSALLFSLAIGTLVVALYRYVILSYEEQGESSDGFKVVQDLESQIPQFTYYWLPGHREIQISVYGAMNEDQQSQVLTRIRATQRSLQATESVTVCFYEKENWRELSDRKSSRWNGFRGKERLLRACVLQRSSSSSP